MSKDIIYRQDAIDVLAELARDRFTIQDWYQIYIDALKDADKKIRYLPTAEPRKGKWLDDCGGLKCSVCGYTIDDPYYVEGYCTRCGSFNGEEEE